VRFPTNKSSTAISDTESLINAGVIPGNKSKVAAKLEEWSGRTPAQEQERQDLFTLRQAAIASGYRSAYLRALMLEDAIPATKKSGIWFLDRDVVEGLRKRRDERFRNTE
jgi:hypothetical protein